MKAKHKLPVLTLLPQTDLLSLALEGEEILTIERNWLAGGEGCPRALARLLELAPQAWLTRWREPVFQQACTALMDCRARSRPFSPWRCGLSAQVAHQDERLLCLCWDAWEQRSEARRSQVRHALIWDLEENAPCPLPALLPRPLRTRRALLRAITQQAQLRLDSGESLLDRDLSGLRRHLSLRRVLLQDGTVSLFYPQASVAGYGEGVPVFPLARLDHTLPDKGAEPNICGHAV